MYTLHIANKSCSSWSLRPWVLMKELSIPFTEKLSPFIEGSNWNEFRHFSPNGLVPCLIDGESAIWDSLAITEYLAERYPGIWPEAPGARAWARCAVAEMHSGFSELRKRCPMDCNVRAELKEIPATLQKDISRIDELWSQGLNQFGGPFLAGSRFSAVDAFYAPVVFRIQTFGLDVSSLALKYVDLMLSVESMQQWQKEAREEPWRELGHERDLIKYATLVEDYRSV